MTPWAGARQLLAIASERLGAGRVREAVAPHRALLSLVLRPLERLLSDAERRQREEQRAHVLGFLTHHGVVRGPLVAAWVGALEALTADMAIAVPDVNALDPESMVLLVELARQRGPRAEMVLGHDPEAIPRDWLWHRSAELNLARLTMLEALATTRVEQLADAEPDTRALQRPPRPRGARRRS